MLGEVADGWASQASADLEAAPTLTHAEVVERMSGNLCRCSAYPNIVAAIQDAAPALDADVAATRRAA